MNRIMIGVLSFLLVSLTFAQTTRRSEEADPLVMAPHHYSLVFENDRVRVLEFHDGPGAKWDLHRHPDTIVVALSEFDLRNVVPGQAPTTRHSKPGEVRWQPATVHTGENIGTTEMKGLLIELKPAVAKNAKIAAPTPTTASNEAHDPLTMAPDNYKLAFENDRVRVLMFTAAAAAKWGLHKHPDQISIALAEYDIRNVVPANSPTVVHRKPGDVRWIPATPHTGENIGRTEAKSVVIELKE